MSGRAYWAVRLEHAVDAQLGSSGDGQAGNRPIGIYIIGMSEMKTQQRTKIVSLTSH